MGNCISKNESGRTQIKTVADILENIKWINEIASEQKERLKNYLLKLDKSYRVEVNTERRNNVHRGVTEIVERISTGIKKHDPRFTGTLVPMGSANNQTKLVDSDEFDFVCELDLNALSRGRGTFKRLDSKGHIVLKIDGEVDFETVKYLPDSEVLVLNMVKLKYLFGEILSKVLSELELPPGWQHGGFYRPSFGGLRDQGPSYVLQLDYLNTTDQVPLCLSVDFVPMIRLPISADEHISRLNSFLKKVTEIDYCWVSLKKNRSYVFYGHAEEIFLSKYSSESTPKTLVRITKALRIVLQENLHMHLQTYPSKYVVEQLINFKKFSGIGETVHYPRVFYSHPCTKLSVPNDYVSWSDIGETETNNYTVKSYWIKLVVLSMMSVDESHGRGWTDDDLPDLVLIVYSLLYHYISSRPGYVDNDDFVKLISILSEDFSKTTTRKASDETQKQSTGVKFTEEHMRLVLKLDIPKGIYFRVFNLKIVLNGIAGICKLLRCVYEGKRTTVLTMPAYRHIPPGMSSVLFSKKEWKEAMDQIEQIYRARATECSERDNLY